MSLSLTELPYAYDALEPYISKDTLEYHHDKHHAAYVANANKLSEGTDFAGMDLCKSIKKLAGSQENSGLFNNLAQVFNHEFYWKSMKPGGGGSPKGKLADKIEEDFGNYEKFCELFKTAATAQFGSGWAWLVLNGHKLEIMKTSNADNPVAHGLKPIITADVWEHAYYLDYQNRRPDYIDNFLQKLVNWEFALNTFLKES